MDLLLAVTAASKTVAGQERQFSFKTRLSLKPRGKKMFASKHFCSFLWSQPCAHKTLMFLVPDLDPTADRESGFLGLLHPLTSAFPNASTPRFSCLASLASSINDASHSWPGLGNRIGQPVPQSRTSGPGRCMQQVPHNYWMSK